MKPQLRKTKQEERSQALEKVEDIFGIGVTGDDWAGL